MPAAGEEIFTKKMPKTKVLQKHRLEIRLCEARLSFTRQKAKCVQQWVVKDHGVARDRSARVLNAQRTRCGEERSRGVARNAILRDATRKSMYGECT